MPGEQRGGGRGLAEQLDHRGRMVGLGLGARADLLPGSVQVHAHPAHAGARQQEPGEVVVVVRHGVGHGDNGKVQSSTLNGGGVR